MFTLPSISAHLQLPFEDDVQSVPEYMTQFQNFINNKQVKIQRKLKYFLKGYEMPFQFSSLLQVVLKIVLLKWRLPMSMQF